jgi:hypothetical protein
LVQKVVFLINSIRAQPSYGQLIKGMTLTVSTSQLLHRSWALEDAVAMAMART